MTDDGDFFTQHYTRLQTDPAFRKALVNDPVGSLRAYYGHMPAGDYRFEVVTQEPDKITIMLPAIPADGDFGDAAVDAVSRRIYDILFTDGVGGYLIPDDTLMWVLRDIRAGVVSRQAAQLGVRAGLMIDVLHDLPRSLCL